MRIIARMNVGGPALQVSGLMRGLDPELFEQRLYAGDPEPGEGDYRRLRAADLPIHPVPALGRSVRPTDDARALAALIRAMRDFRPHVVHTHTAKAGALGRLAAAACGVPARVHTFHGHLLHGYFSPARTAVLVRAERRLARMTDTLVAVGTRVRDDLLAARIGRPDQFEVVPPGVSLAAPPDRDTARRMLGLSGTGPVVAFVGRITGIKRPDRMLAVARELRADLPDLRFVVCGEGDRLAAVRSAATAEGLPVTFLRFRPDVETVYAAADLVLLTSDNEGMPVCLIEAGLAGRPAVATDVGAVAEVIEHGRTGLLCDGEVPSLCEHVRRLLRDETLRHRMGRAARELTGERFGGERLVADTTDLYRRLAIRRGWWPAETGELVEGRRGR
ncbi:MAG TPA: glycosyltransferase [Rugosimonospora sp.]|jgi:glycosyltransferase involved in cell wall biosynthesis